MGCNQIPNINIQNRFDRKEFEKTFIKVANKYKHTGYYTKTLLHKVTGYTIEKDEIIKEPGYVFLTQKKGKLIIHIEDYEDVFCEILDF